MNFEFSENLQGFETTSCVDLSRMKYNDEPVLYCKCNETGDNIGIYRIINLPNITQYVLKITGIANNNRTYIKVTDTNNQPLIENEKISYFKKDIKNTITLKFYSKYSQIKLHILMGGDSLAVKNNSFILHNLKLTPQHTNTLNNSNNTSFSDLKITRKFNTIKDLENESNNPLRSNATPMEIGEYAILKGTYNDNNNNNNNDNDNNDNRDDCIADDLYILSNNGLKYVNKIGTGLPVFFGDSLPIIPGKVMPIYDDHQEALNDLTKNPKEFYSPKMVDDKEYQYHNHINENIYLYLDSSGYVRWLKY